MPPPILSRAVYVFLFSLLGLVYLAGLFVPLMDNDAAHHANIALHMYLTGDYVTLVDHAGAYLDKPHLFFWLCAFSYKLFGVSGFAYKFPSFLFSILGAYSAYRLGKVLYDRETGRLASLILASAFAFMLANSDVRMDAILTASIVFATWQLVEFTRHRKILNVAGAALGLALGFCTKGHIGIFVPAVAVIFYILYQKNWRMFLHWKWLLLVILFALLISPVVYCYYLQFNLHPETIVRGRDHINGVKFILLNQSIERLGAVIDHNTSTDYFLFLHSFLWAFAPWSILAYLAVAGRIRHFLQRKEEWLTPGVFITMLLLVTFSGFKLPHYLNIAFPSSAVLTAAYIIKNRGNEKWVRSVFIIQLVVFFLVLVVAGILNGWAFPLKNPWLIAGLLLLLFVILFVIIRKKSTGDSKIVLLPVLSMVTLFYLLNSNFYPRLLSYQGGNVLAEASKGKIDPEAVYFWNDFYSSSFSFYAVSLRKPFADSVVRPGKKAWLLYDIRNEEEIKSAGYKLNHVYETFDFEITKLTLGFLNPGKRDRQCTRMLLSEISR